MPTASRAAHVGIVSRRGAAVPRVTRSLSRGRNSRAPIDGQSWSRAVSSRSGDARAALNPLAKRRRAAGRSRGMTDRSVATSGMGEGVWAVDIACMLDTGHGVRPERAGRQPHYKRGVMMAPRVAPATSGEPPCRGRQIVAGRPSAVAQSCPKLRTTFRTTCRHGPIPRIAARRCVRLSHVFAGVTVPAIQTGAWETRWVASHCRRAAQIRADRAMPPVRHGLAFRVRPGRRLRCGLSPAHVGRPACSLRDWPQGSLVALVPERRVSPRAATPREPRAPRSPWPTRARSMRRERRRPVAPFVPRHSPAAAPTRDSALPSPSRPAPGPTPWRARPPGRPRPEASHPNPARRRDKPPGPIETVRRTRPATPPGSR